MYAYFKEIITKFREIKENLREIPLMFKTVRPKGKILFFFLIGAIFDGIIAVIFPLFVGKVMDRFLNIKHLLSGGIKTLLIIGMFLLIHTSFRSFLKYKRKYINEDFLKKIRGKYFNKLIHLPVRFFDNKNPTDIGEMIFKDTESVVSIWTEKFSQIISNLMQFIGSIIFLIILGKFFAIPFLLIIPMLVGAYMVISWSTFKLARKSLEEEIKLHKQAEDTARYIRLIKAFNMEELYKKRFVLNLNKIKDIAMKRVKLMELTFFSQQIIFYGMTGLILIMASFFINKPGFSAGLITTLFLYAHKYMGSTFQLGQNLITLQRSIVSFKRLKEIEANYLSKKEEIKTKQAKKVLPIQKKAKIRFKNLYFRYNESFVLNNISFEIFEGEKIALVGPSGSGKSTIFQLMLGFYSPEKGEIFFDEIPYLFYDKENMQKEFSYIPQEEMIFPGTIMENVTVDGAKIDNKRFKDVLKLSGLDSISPDKDASSLSVGQKQRIAWARAIYKNAPIFIFDEPTSNIDPIHTFVMLKNLISIYKDKTLIMACHHMELIELVERIIVIENGRIKEIGTHDELIKRNGIYYELLNSRYLVANI